MNFSNLLKNLNFLQPLKFKSLKTVKYLQFNKFIEIYLKFPTELKSKNTSKSILIFSFIKIHRWNMWDAQLQHFYSYSIIRSILQCSTRFSSISSWRSNWITYLLCIDKNAQKTVKKLKMRRIIFYFTALPFMHSCLWVCRL